MIAIGRRVACLAFVLIGVSVSFAAGGTWKYGREDRGHPQLTYSENGKNVFMVGCGHAFAIHAVYPGAPKKDEAKATITVSNGKSKMNFTGKIDSGYSSEDPPHTAHFIQWDLGYARQDDDLYGKKWKALEAKLFDLLDVGKPLTVSAEGKRYVLPPIDVKGWKEDFKKTC